MADELGPGRAPSGGGPLGSLYYQLLPGTNCKKVRVTPGKQMVKEG